MAIYIIDCSNRKLAGDWVRTCLPQYPDISVVDRERCDLVPATDKVGCLIITGSEHSVFENEPWIGDVLKVTEYFIDAKAPVFGICFGHQLIARCLYGKDALKRRAIPEVGWYHVRVSEHPVFEGIPPVIQPYVFHFDEVLPEKAKDFDIIASSDLCPNHGMLHRSLPVMGVQFHPETNKENGLGGYKKDSVLLSAFGISIDDILATNTSDNDHYYPGVVRNFVERYYEPEK